MFIQEHNCETGEVTQKELTAKQIKDRQDQYEFDIATAEAKAQAKAAAESKLAALGLTTEDLKALGL